jgi:hypothetical protein
MEFIITETTFAVLLEFGTSRVMKTRAANFFDFYKQEKNNIDRINTHD